MKLHPRIAGTLALPLALAVAASTQAATIINTDQHQLNITGFVSAQAHMTNYDSNRTGAGTVASPYVYHDSDLDYHMSLGTSRLGLTYINKTEYGNVRFMYENDWAGGANATSQPSNSYRLRHLAIFYGGWVAGQTWSGFSNNTGLPEVLDHAGLAGPDNGAAPAPRNPLLGYNFTLAEGVTAGLFVEEHSKEQRTSAHVRRATPDLTANFKGRFGTTDVFAAVRFSQFDDRSTTGAPADPAETEGVVDFTFGLNTRISDAFSLKLAATAYGADDSDNVDAGNRERTVVGVAGQYRINDQLRTNLVVQQSMLDADDADSTAVWLNAFYKMPAGWEWGAELRFVSADKDAGAVNALNDGDTRISVQAKYAF